MWWEERAGNDGEELKREVLFRDKEENVMGKEGLARRGVTGESGWRRRGQQQKCHILHSGTNKNSSSFLYLLFSACFPISLLRQTTVSTEIFICNPPTTFLFSKALVNQITQKTGSLIPWKHMVGCQNTQRKYHQKMQ